MKRKIAACLCAILVSSSLICGCGDSGKSAEKTSSTTETSAKEATETAEATSDVSEIEVEEITEAETESAEAEETAAETEEAASCDLEDGTYIANVDTDSSMFHINETCEGTCTLTVEKGKMTAHLVLGGTGIVNLYQGSAEDAQKEGAELIEPVTESVTYSDGITEEVFAFDVPCPVLDEEFPVAIVGEKGNWYDHTVIISNPVPAE